MNLRSRPWLLCGLLCGLLLVAGTSEAAKTKKKLMHRAEFDPNAPRVGLLEGIESEVISVQVVARNAEEGAILVENLTDQPITVELPEAFVGVQVLPQFGGGNQGGGLGGVNQNNGAGGGQNQAMGGGFGGQQGGGQGGFGGGQGGGQGASSLFLRKESPAFLTRPSALSMASPNRGRRSSTGSSSRASIRVTRPSKSCSSSLVLVGSIRRLPRRRRGTCPAA
ncbi:MAG: hypothetical protein R3B90_07895 [Planctomycetaceae bacterium]